MSPRKLYTLSILALLPTLPAFAQTDGKYHGVAPFRLISNLEVAADTEIIILDTDPYLLAKMNRGKGRTNTTIIELPPSGMVGVILQITVVNPTSAGHVTVWSPEVVSPRPLTSILNYEAGKTVSGMTIVSNKNFPNTVRLWQEFTCTWTFSDTS
jgi:hypothetical protein